MDNKTQELLASLRKKIDYTIDQGLVNLLQAAANKIEEQDALLVKQTERADNGK